MNFNSNLLELIDESIKLENNLGDLYAIFCKHFTDHKDFWNQLSVEEYNHASILKGGREYFIPLKTFPREIICENLDLLKNINENILRNISNFNIEPISLFTALNIALQMETSAGERHYENAMNNKLPSEVIKIFQKLNDADLNHAERIKKLISLTEKTI